MLLRVRVGNGYFLQVCTLSGSVANGGHHSGMGPHSPLAVSDIQFILLVSWGFYILRVNKYIILPMRTVVSYVLTSTNSSPICAPVGRPPPPAPDPTSCDERGHRAPVAVPREQEWGCTQSARGGYWRCQPEVHVQVYHRCESPLRTGCCRYSIYRLGATKGSRSFPPPPSYTDGRGSTRVHVI